MIKTFEPLLLKPPSVDLCPLGIAPHADVSVTPDHDHHYDHYHDHLDDYDNYDYDHDHQRIINTKIETSMTEII